MNTSLRNIILLVIGQVLALTSVITLVTYAALVSRMLTGSTSMATIPAALAMIAAALTAYKASMFMKRFGRKRGFQFGALFALLSGIFTFSGIYIENFYVFCFGVMVHGIFQSFAAYYRFAAMEVSAPRFKKQAISYVLSGGLFAALISPTAAKFFETHFFLPIPYAGTFILVILLSLLTQLTLLFLHFPPEIDHIEHDENGQEIPATQVSWLDILRRPGFLCASLNAAGAYLMMSYVMTSSPIQIVEYCGFQITDAASVIQWHTAAMFLPAFFTGSLVARFGAVRIIMIGFVCFMISAAFAIQGLELINFYGSLVLLGLGWNFLFTAGTALLESAYKPHEKSQVQGLNDFVVYSLAATSTLTSGFMLETIGWKSMNAMVFGIVGLLLFITLWYVKVNRKTVGLTSTQEEPN